MPATIRTLIVDDSSTLRAMLDVVISGHRDFRPPEHAAGAFQAIEILDERLFELVLLGVNMHGILAKKHGLGNWSARGGCHTGSGAGQAGITGCGRAVSENLGIG